jgi:UDP:flavonoid glycosyltransferase YjiC (YdhE family)
MPHFTMMALGSRGDVVPYLALGRRLRAAGHAVRFVTYATFGALVTEHGLDAHLIDVDVRALINGLQGQQLLAGGQNVLRQALAIRRSFGRVSDTTAAVLLDPALRATDAVLCQTPGALYGADLAEAAGVPLVQLAVMPLARTRQWPHLAFPAGLGWLPGFTPLSYRLAEQLVWQMFRPSINRFRRRLGLRPQSLGGYFRQLEARGVPVLNGFSRHVVPRPPDWPAHVQQTGYWHPHDPAWSPPADLLRFLDQGPAPVFLGFGSMPVRDPLAVTATLVEALRLSGQRGVLLGGWGGLGDAVLPPSVYRLEYAAFEWLFPRMAALIHHGGSGTTGMGLRAGVPNVVVPFAFDQFFWGERVRALGVGPVPVPYGRLSAPRLAAAITAAVGDSAMRRQSAAVGAALAAEDGLGQAVALIERYSCLGDRPPRWDEA